MALVQRLADQIDIVRNPRKDLAMGGGIEILERQAADFLIDFLAQIVGDLHGNAGHDEALHVGKYHGERIQDNQEHNQSWPYRQNPYTARSENRRQISPSASLVVTLPSSLGPTMEKADDKAAKIITMMIFTR